MVEEVAHRLRRIELADRIEARVGTQPVEHQAVVVAYGSIVELLCPVGSMIHLSHDGEETVLVLACFLDGQALSTHRLLEDGLDLRLGVGFVIEFLDTMVGESASVLLEEVVPFLQGIYHILEFHDVDTRDLGQLFY